MSTGKRYTKEEKKEILKFRETHTYQETSEKYGISQMTLARWSQRLRRNEKEEKPEVIKKEVKIQIGESLNDLQRAKAMELAKAAEVIKFIQGVKNIALIIDEKQLLALISIKELNLLERNELVVITVEALNVGRHARDQLKTGGFEMIFIKSKLGSILVYGVGPHLVMSLLFDKESDFKALFQDDFAVIERVAQLLGESFQ